MCTWFKHDSQAGRDRKLEHIRGIYGRNGVCMFWDLLEALANDDDRKLPNNISVIASIIRVSGDEDMEVLRAVLYDFDLFQDDGNGYLYSERLSRSLIGVQAYSNSKPKRNLSDEGRARLRQNAYATNAKRNANKDANSDANDNANSVAKRNAKNANDDANSDANDNANSVAKRNAKNANDDANSDANGGDIGGDKSPLRELRSKNIEREGKTQKRFTPPTLDEVKEYCQSKGYAWNPEDFLNYYESNGWMVGRNKMKDWRASVRSWNSREGNTYKNWQAGRGGNGSASTRAAIAQQVQASSQEVADANFDKFRRAVEGKKEITFDASTDPWRVNN